MLGNFIYENPTKVFFGRGAVENLAEALKPYGSQVVLVYGGGSIKKMAFMTPYAASWKLQARM